MICPGCHTFVDERADFCPACLGEIAPRESPASAAAPPAESAPQPSAAPSFETRFPGQQPCGDHPDYPIVGTCARCGRFVCVRCAPELATRASANCAACDVRENTSPEGIGGWLILVAIGVVVGPVGLLIGRGGLIYLLARSYERTGHLSSAQSSIALTCVLALALAVFESVVAVAFFLRKRGAPRLLVISYVLSVVYCAMRFALESDVSEALASEDARALIRSTLGAAIWIPYLFLSRRVKATFVR